MVMTAPIMKMLLRDIISRSSLQVLWLQSLYLHNWEAWNFFLCGWAVVFWCHNLCSLWRYFIKSFRYQDRWWSGLVAGALGSGNARAQLFVFQWFERVLVLWRERRLLLDLFFLKGVSETDVVLCYHSWSLVVLDLKSQVASKMLSDIYAPQLKTLKIQCMSVCLCWSSRAWLLWRSMSKLRTQTES
jgi:hypothetical protein